MKKEPQTVIYQTTDYEQFQPLKANRSISFSKVADLAVSILQQNLLHLNPIIVNDRLEVIDGQHRLEVAKNNKLPIYYVIGEDANIENTRLLNTYSSPWASKAFVESFAAEGVKSYVWLHSLMQEYTLSLSQALCFISGDGQWSFKNVRNGKFLVTEKQKEVAEKRAELLNRLRPYMTRKGMIPRYFLRELVTLDKSDLLERLVETVEEKELFFYPEPERVRARNQLAHLLKGKGK